MTTIKCLGEVFMKKLKFVCFLLTSPAQCTTVCPPSRSSAPGSVGPSLV